MIDQKQKTTSCTLTEAGATDDASPRETMARGLQDFSDADPAVRAAAVCALYEQGDKRITFVKVTSFTANQIIQSHFQVGSFTRALNVPTGYLEN